jgi:hypothetical protein
MVFETLCISTVVTGTTRWRLAPRIEADKVVCICGRDGQGQKTTVKGTLPLPHALTGRSFPQPVMSWPSKSAAAGSKVARTHAYWVRVVALHDINDQSGRGKGKGGTTHAAARAGAGHGGAAPGAEGYTLREALNVADIV